MRRTAGDEMRRRHAVRDALVKKRISISALQTAMNHSTGFGLAIGAAIDRLSEQAN